MRALCVLSLVLISFAHRPGLASGSDAAAGYVFPDGSVAVTCLNGDDSDGRHKAGSGPCEFCRIAASIVVPSPPESFESCPVSVRARFLLPDDDDIVRQVVFAHAPPRGPPFFQI